MSGREDDLGGPMAVGVTPLAIVDFDAPVVSGQQGVIRGAFGLWRTRIGAALVLLLIATAIAGPWVAPYGADEFVGTANLRHLDGSWLGTDYFGQDVWSRFLHGGRSILFLASVSTLIGFVFGAAIGMTAAYNRGRLDDTLMRAMDIMLAFHSSSSFWSPSPRSGPRRG